MLKIFSMNALSIFLIFGPTSWKPGIEHHEKWAFPSSHLRMKTKSREDPNPNYYTAQDLYLTQVQVRGPTQI